MTIAQMNSNVPERIEAIIASKGLKKKAVAMRAGMTPQTMSALLSGRKVIKVVDIVALAEALEVQPSDLII